jgi:hypothetical protein
MLFNKQFIAESFENKLKKHFYEVHPYKTVFKEGEKSNYELFIMNYFTFFDIESENMKEKRAQVNQEIASNCFNDDVIDTYPNVLKIEQCIRNTEIKHLGKYYDKRDVFFGNGIFCLIKYLLILMKH